MRDGAEPSRLQITRAVGVAAESCGDLAEHHNFLEPLEVGGGFDVVGVRRCERRRLGPRPNTTDFAAAAARCRTAQRTDPRMRTTKFRLRCLRGVRRQKRVATRPPPIGHSASALAVDLAVGRPLCGRGRLGAPIGTHKLCKGFEGNARAVVVVEHLGRVVNK